MDFAKSSYNSIHGEIKAEWKKTAPNTFQYTVLVPPNCDAEVILPNGTTAVKSGLFSFNVTTL